MPRQKYIITINQATKDPIIDPNTWFDAVLLTFIKPGKLVFLRYDLVFVDNTVINYDHRTSPNGEWWYGNDIILIIYRQQHPTTNPIFPARTDLATTFPHAEDLIACRTGSVHRSPGIPYQFTSDLDLTLPEGTIDGAIEAPAGTGNIGPLALVWANPGSLENEHMNSEFGGHTVEHFRDKEKDLSIVFDIGDVLRLTAIYNFLDNVNTGQNLFGTIEFIIKY